MGLVILEQRSRLACPHCDKPMNLAYVAAEPAMRLICTDGCKAEYDVVLTIGQTTEGPICGAKRVQTYGR